MSRTISFALGNIWSWGKSLNRNNLISHIKRFNVDGVEITFSSKEELFAFKLSDENKKWLRSLNYVSIHAPFKLIRKAKNQAEVIKQLKIIDKIYREINAKNVVIHPTDLPSPSILNKFKFKVSVENLVKKRNFTIPKLKKIFKKYPNLGLCLDVAHAFFWSKYETKNLIKAFGDRITQIHFSGTFKGKDHLSLGGVSKDFMFSINPIFKITAPIVIEEDIRIKTDKFVHKEVNFIRKLFKY